MTDDNPLDLATGILGFVDVEGLNALPEQMRKAGISPYDALASLAREVHRLAVYYTTIDQIARYVAGDGTDPQRVALSDGIREGQKDSNSDESLNAFRLAVREEFEQR